MLLTSLLAAQMFKRLAEGGWVWEVYVLLTTEGYDGAVPPSSLLLIKIILLKPQPVAAAGG